MSLAQDYSGKAMLALRVKQIPIESVEDVISTITIIFWGVHVTLQQLRYVVTLAEHGNFVCAARECHVSQSTLSAQIKKLEEYLGTTLFERGGRRTARLTEFGARIVAQARVAVEAAAKIRQTAKHGVAAMEGEISVGAIPGLWPSLAPTVLSAIGNRFPDLHLSVRDNGIGDVAGAVAAGDIDVALLADPDDTGDLSVCPLFREPYVAMVARDHPFATQERVAYPALYDEPVFVLEDQGRLPLLKRRATVGNGRRRNGKQGGGRLPGVAHDTQALVSLVAEGAGGALLPALVASSLRNTAQRSAIAIKPLVPPVPHRTVYAAWRASSAKSASLLQWAEFLRRYLPAAVEIIRVS
jgi:LysR family hydrogen peroxide-inducible transcriptional activator